MTELEQLKRGIERLQVELEMDRSLECGLVDGSELILDHNGNVEGYGDTLLQLIMNLGKYK